MVCVEKQLVLNRLGENSLNNDSVEIIKEFLFKSRMRVDAEQKIKRLNCEIKLMARHVNCWPKWSVHIHTRDEKKIKPPRNIEAVEDHGWAEHRGWVTKTMGSIMCGYCGNYRARSERNINNPLYEHEWVPYRKIPFKCAPRARCQCNIGDFWESDVNVVDNEIHTWPPQEGSLAYFQIYES